ncbi:phage tail tape measure protein [Asanoa sp. WMMD1127]|uniref:phage tail tape measure protein n=1 Tax=Asanoa sp. WMMD1127 TaxID=3016107 RepID=UPI002415E346|nr:phage tail tape measure protein [Asanoa sp. WMMD1127]MDG4826018.1 phage tail tape measure protein [Asanoa sp. WMMD1127]
MADKAGLAFAGLVAAAGGLSVAFAEAMNLDAVKGKFAAQMGDAGYAAELGDVAGKLYTSNFGESVEDNMNAIRRVMSTGLLSEDASNADIERITAKAQTLSKVFGQDVAQSARAAGQMVRTGLAKDADEAFDILTRGFQQTGDNAGDLLDTVSEYSTQFRKLGLDGTTAMGLIQQGLKGGARDADIVADSLKEFSIRAVDGSKLTAEGFKMLGLDAGKMAKQIGKGGDDASKGLDTVLDKLRGIKDPVKQNQAAVALFGTQAEDLGEALLKLDPSKATTAMGDVSGAAEKAGKAMDTPGAALQKFKRSVQQAIVEKVSAALPIIISFGQWFSRNKEWIMPIAVGLLAIGAALGVVAIATKVYTAYQWLLNVALNANPIGIIILALIALAAGIAYAWTHSEKFRKIVIAVWNAVKGGVMAAINWLKVKIPAAWGWIKDRSVALFNGAKNGVVNIATGIKNAVTGAIKGAVDKVTGIKDKVLGFFKSAGTWLKEAGKSIIRGLIQGVSDMIGSLKEKFNSVTNLIPDWKGPLDKDKVLLRPAGKAIMGGLIRGVDDESPNVKKTFNRVTWDIARTGSNVSTGALTAPSRSGGVKVEVNVRGHVTAERDLAKAIAVSVRDEIARNGKRNGGSGLGGTR